MSNEFIENLNPNQREAVLAVKGPVRIIAGAGSGKTRVIINKIAYLVKYCGLKPWRICAVTFTNKAASEMKERLGELLGLEGKHCKISTYHALCVRILREDIEILDYPKSFNILDTQDQEKIFRDIYKNNNMKYDAQELRLLKNFISTWKNDFVSPLGAIDDSYGDTKRYAHVYQLYEQKLRELDSVDFNDLILLTYKIFKNYPIVLQKWQERFDYILVDEFQDTNELQFDIIKWLTGNKQDLTVVGDPDQTIYSWRGAKIGLIINFDRYFKNTETIVLNENYRSSHNILSLANNLIANNEKRIKKDLFTTNEYGIKPILYHGSSSSDESDFIARKIQDLVKNDEFYYKDILILYRANYLSRDLEVALADYGISYRIFGAFKFYERKEVKDVLSLLKLVVNNDSLAVERVLLFTPKVGPKAVEQVIKLLKANNLSFTELLKNQFALLTKSLQTALYDLRETILAVDNKLTTTTSVEEIVQILLKTSKYHQRLKDNFEEEREQNILELISALAKFDQQNSEFQGLTLLNEYLQLISLQTDSESDTLTDNTVSLMTIHNAKGLEKRIVFVVGLNEGVFPSVQAIKTGIEQLEEERRTLYVAITRARDILYLSYADGYSFVTGNERFPSRFIKELDNNFFELVENEGAIEKIKVNYRKNIEWENSSNGYSSNQRFFTSSSHINQDLKKNLWKINDSVKHEIFGIGVVVKIIAQNVQVVFPSPFGSKIISADSQVLTKVEN